MNPPANPETSLNQSHNSRNNNNHNSHNRHNLPNNLNLNHYKYHDHQSISTANNDLHTNNTVVHPARILNTNNSNNSLNPPDADSLQAEVVHPASMVLHEAVHHQTVTHAPHNLNKPDKPKNGEKSSRQHPTRIKIVDYTAHCRLFFFYSSKFCFVSFVSFYIPPLFYAYVCFPFFVCVFGIVLCFWFGYGDAGFYAVLIC